MAMNSSPNKKKALSTDAKIILQKIISWSKHFWCSPYPLPIIGWSHVQWSLVAFVYVICYMFVVSRYLGPLVEIWIILSGVSMYWDQKMYKEKNVHIYINANRNTNTSMHVHAHTCTYMHIHAHTCTYMHIHAHTCTYMHIHAHLHIHAHTCTYMHIHAHTCTLAHLISFYILIVNHWIEFNIY